MERQRLDPKYVGGRLVDIARNSIDSQGISYEYSLGMQSGGFVDLGIVPTPLTTIRCDCRFTDVTSLHLFGSHNPVNDKRFYLGVNNNSWRLGYGTEYVDFGSANTSRHLFSIMGDGKVYVDNTLLQQFSGDISNINNSFKLWYCGTTQYNNIIFWEIQVFEGALLIANLKPVDRGKYGAGATHPATAPGFWDTVRGRYFYATVDPIFYRTPSTDGSLEKPKSSIANCNFGIEIGVDKTVTNLTQQFVTHRDDTSFGINVKADVIYRDFYQTYTDYRDDSFGITIGADKEELTLTQQFVEHVEDTNFGISITADVILEYV